MNGGGGVKPMMIKEPLHALQSHTYGTQQLAHAQEALQTQPVQNCPNSRNSVKTRKLLVSRLIDRLQRSVQPTPEVHSLQHANHHRGNVDDGALTRGRRNDGVVSDRDLLGEREEEAVVER